jgi:hypothetical protein
MLRRLKILTPLSFLLLISPDLRPYQWTLPVAITALALLGFYLLPAKPPLFTEKGLVNTINGLLDTLIGFYIAALAAVATFSNPALDQTMKGRAPTISTYRQGERTVEKLTRRRFLVMLFGYCAFLSIMLFSLGVVSQLVAPSLARAAWLSALKFAWLSVYFSMASSLLIVTLLGLHYLVDRMHRE